MADKVNFLGVVFDRMSFDEAIKQLLDHLMTRKGGQVYFANAHTMVTANQNQELAIALKQCDMLLADGSGTLWSSALVGTPLKYNLNGTDLVPALCKAGAAKGLSIYLLGAKVGVAKAAAHKLAEKYPGLVIAGVQHGYFPEEKTEEVLKTIRNASPSLLLVAMGVPQQEIWINKYSSKLPNITSMGVGGLFDFLSERVPRAPLWIRSIGLEWLWRLKIEPSRLWQRYTLGNLIFLRLVLDYLLITKGNTQPRNPEVKL